VDKLTILFENEHFIAVDKPAGMLSVPSRMGKDDPRACAVQELEQMSKTAMPVHRLDVEVSGLLLFAKSPNAHRVANGWFEQRLIHKFYEAWTEGDTPPAEQRSEWRSTLLRGKRRAYESPHGKPSITRAVFVEKKNVAGVGSVLSWELEPLTGRSHQLRYELAHHGYPIIGDELYGAKSKFEPNGIALRAVRIDFRECLGAKSEFDLPDQVKAPSLVVNR
jgi:tRNA pseudouridine32 synthase/23S rRNA pseudouridine746 synthase